MLYNKSIFVINTNIIDTYCMKVLTIARQHIAETLAHVLFWGYNAYSFYFSLITYFPKRSRFVRKSKRKNYALKKLTKLSATINNLSNNKLCTYAPVCLPVRTSDADNVCSPIGRRERHIDRDKKIYKDAALRLDCFV